MALTVDQFAQWGRFKVPIGDEADLCSLVLSASLERLSREFYVDDPPSSSQTVAVYLLANRVWSRRNTPEGRGSFGGDVAVMVAGEDLDVSSLLVPRSGLA